MIKLYKDRKQAAKRLQEMLPYEQMQKEGWIIVAVSKGGVLIADALRGKNTFRVDWMFGESIMAPNNPDCELGRVSESEEIVINDDLVKAFGVQYDYIYGEAHRKHEEKILSKIYHFRKGRPLTDLNGKNILLVDEGTESGLKFMCAIKTVLGSAPNALYAAAPVMPTEVFDAIEPLCDALFCPQVLDDYIETSCYYSHMDTVSDETIITILGD